MAKNYKDLHMEVALDLDNLADEIARKLDHGQLVTFIGSLVESYGELDLDEAVFLSQLRNMISLVEGCPEEYAGTKWEMLPAMKGLLDK